jgi:hypothetical protein
MNPQSETDRRGAAPSFERVTSGAAPSFDDWSEEGLHLRRKGEATTWALGDWLLRGAVLEYDPGFKHSMRITGYSRSFLYGLRQVSEAWPAADRLSEVAWSIHRDCLREKDPVERRALLKRAAVERLSQHDFSRIFRAKPEPEAERSRAYENRQVCCPSCGHVFPIKGHKVQLTGKAGAPITDRIAEDPRLISMEES